MKRAVFLLVTTLAAAAGCDSSPTSPSDVIGLTWRLVSLQEAGSTPVVIENLSRYTLRFDNAGRLSVKSDCNSCSGPYSLGGASMKVGALACTRAYCGETSLDGRYTAALERAQSVSRNGDELTVQGGTVTLRFRE